MISRWRILSVLLAGVFLLGGLIEPKAIIAQQPVLAGIEPLDDPSVDAVLKPQATPSPKQLPWPKEIISATLPSWSPPQAEPGEELLPINLPAALKLAKASAWDIIIARNSSNSPSPSIRRRRSCGFRIS